MKSLYFLSFYLLVSFSVFAQWTDDTKENLHVAGIGAADIQSVGVVEGKTWIAFYSQRGSNYDMRAQLVDSTGKKLLGENGVLVSNMPSGSATFVFNVCANGRGELIIGYQYEVSGIQNAVVSKVGLDGQLLWGENGVVVGPGLSPYPAVLTTGETVIAWNNSITNTISMQRLATDGTFKADSAIDVKAGTTTTTRGQVVANENGDFTLIFQKRGSGISTTLYAQRYNHFFKALYSEPVQLSDQTTSAARYYSVIAEADTTYVGYYSSVGSRFNAFVQRINPDESDILPYGMNGTHFSNDTGINDNYQQTISIASLDSTPALWAVCTYSNTTQTEYGVYVQRFLKTTGNRLLTNKAKNVFPISTNMKMQVGDLQLTGDEKPGFITYDVNNQIYASKLDQIGDRDGGADDVLMASSSNPKSRFCFAANDAIAVAVWSEDRGSGEMPFAQNINGKAVTGVLPVVISDFKVVKNGKEANLSWATLTETNNKGFYVERSSDGRNFTSLGFIASKAGSISSQKISYAYTDRLPFAFNNYYRLKQVDNDGHIVYSETIMVTFENAISFVVSKLYPNPARSIVSISVESNASSKLTAVITGINGKILMQQSFFVTVGSNTIPVNVQSLSAGTYVIKVTGNGVEKTMKFNKL